MAELGGKTLTVTRTDQRYGTVVRLEGVIDESFALDPEILRSKRPIVFDMGGIRRVTSFGVRQWITALRELTTYYCFVNCRPAVVSQFNMVANFGVAGEVITLFVPFVCPECDKEIELLIDRRDRQTMSAKLPPIAKCTECDVEADFDDTPEVYFSYAMSAPPPNPPAHVATMLDKGTSAPTALRVRKEVLDSLTVIALAGPLEKANALRRVADGLEGATLFWLRDITDCNAGGADALLAIQTGSVALEMAAVPLIVLEQMSDERFAGLREKIVSLSLPFQCEACGPSDVSIAHLPLAVTSLAPPCQRCGTPMSLAQEVLSSAALSGFALARPSPLVAAYLDTASSRGSDDFAPLSESSGSVTVGTFGSYRLLQRLGRGGMAEVFLARQLGPEGFERKVALKRILPAFCSDPEFVEMFLEEARLAARLSHPNIVQILELGRVGAQYFIAMEYVKGCDLQTIVRICRANQIAIPTEIVCRIGIDICAALSAAHSYTEDDMRMPIVHRDVSPHNVLVSETGVVKLTDFGIAKASGSHVSTHPDDGGLKGKVSYFAPERVLSIGDPLDPRQDIFSVGLTLYVCLTGEHPFKRDSNAATVHAILSSPVIPPGLKRDDVPMALDMIVTRALARKPEERYANALSLQMDLQNFLHQMSAPTTDVHLGQWLRGLLEKRDGTDSPSSPGSTSRSGVRGQETSRPGRRTSENTITESVTGNTEKALPKKRS